MAPGRRRLASPVPQLVWAHPIRVLPPAVRPRRPRLLCRRGLVCVHPACLVVLSGLIVGSPDVAPSPESRLCRKTEFCVPNVSRGLSRPASALAAVRAAVPRSPYPPSRCAALARVGAPLPLPRARRIRSCGRVPLTSVPWLIRAAGQRPCGGAWLVAFRTEPGKL